MAIEVSYLTAFGAGMISFVTPCVLPLVPPYLCYMAGVSIDDFRDDGIADTDIEATGSGAATAKMTK